MALHKLDKGRDLIDDLVGLGTALGYTVEQELPVEKRPGGPAVDIAWFRDGESRYPLFIIEVESLASNTMANNAVKVFSRSSTEFEKPLFFFHVIAKAGSRTSRVDDLREMFGKHNYRLYVLDDDGGVGLVRDVLAQHRRLSAGWSVASFLDAEANWNRLQAKINDVFHFAWDLGLRGTYLRDCAVAALATGESVYEETYLSLVKRQLLVRESPDTGYGTYVSKWLELPVHLALLAGVGSINKESAAEAVAHWQESGIVGMRQIGPHFGLSRDYDDLICNLAGPFWALIAGLAGRSSGIAIYAAEQLTWLVGRIGLPGARVRLFGAAWGLYVAAFANRADLFVACTEIIAVAGGLRPDALFALPGYLDTETENAWEELAVTSTELLPSMTELLARCARLPQAGRPSSALMAMSFLNDEMYPSRWGEDLLALVAR